MGICSWDLDGGFNSSSLPIQSPCNPRLTVRCEYPGMPPTEVTFGLSERYGIHTARDAHDWFLSLMGENEEFVPHFVALLLRV